MSEKEQAVKALQGLREDATLEDVMERIVVLWKIREGIKEADDGRGIPHEEVKKRLLGETDHLDAARNR